MLGLLWGTGCAEAPSTNLLRAGNVSMLVDPSARFTAPPEAGEAWQKLDRQLLDTLPTDPRTRIWFRVPLEGASGTHLFLNACHNISALYQNQQLIARDPLQRSYPQMLPLFMEKPIIPLPEAAEGSSLYLQTIYSGRTQYAIDCLHFKLSQRYDTIFLLLESSGPELIAAFVATFLGLLSLFLTLSRRQRMVTFFSLFVFTMAGIYFNSSLLVKMVLGPIVNWEALSHFSVLAAPVFFLLFFEEVIKPPYQLARWMAWLNTIILGIEVLTFLAVPELNLPLHRRYYFLLLLGEILLIPPLGIIGILQKRPFARSFGCGSVLMVAAAAHDVWADLFALSKPLVLMPFALVGFISLLLGIITRLATQEEASIEKQKLQLAEERTQKLMHDVAVRTEDLGRNSEELARLNQELSDKHEFLAAQAQKVSEYAEEKDRLLQRIHEVRETALPEILSGLQGLHEEQKSERVDAIKEELLRIQQVFEEVASIYAMGQHMRDRRFLIFDTEKKNQRFYKLALGGSKLELTLVGSEEDFQQRLKDHTFEIIGLHESVAASLSLAFAASSESSLIIFHENEAPQQGLEHLPRAHYLPLYLPRPLLQKLLLTHVTKLITREFFGIEKYLGWGSMVKELSIGSREQHAYALRSIKLELEALSLAPELVQHIMGLSKQLLELEAAQTLVRTQAVRKAENQSLLRYGYDSHLIVLSISLQGDLMADPKALFKKNQVEEAGDENAVQGLLRGSDCLVFNSTGEVTHELLAIIVNDSASSRQRSASFHLFTLDQFEGSRRRLPSAG